MGLPELSNCCCLPGTPSTHNEALDREIRPECRIGIALGEAIIADNAVIGALAPALANPDNSGAVARPTQ